MTALGWIGSLLVVASLAQTDVRRIRALNLAASALLLVFNLTIGVPSMIALNGVLVLVNAYHLGTTRTCSTDVDVRRAHHPQPETTTARHPT